MRWCGVLTAMDAGAAPDDVGDAPNGGGGAPNGAQGTPNVEHGGLLGVEIALYGYTPFFNRRSTCSGR